MVISLAVVLTLQVGNYPTIIGSDWLWYRNGIDRLVHGLPLYDPRMTSGAYDYLGAELHYQFNQTPWLLVLVGPVATIPEPFAQSVWFVLISSATIGSCWMLRPRDVSPPALLALWTSLFVWPCFLMIVAWGNVHALVMLGVALWVCGWRRRSDLLAAAGLYLASLKVVPVVPLVMLAIKERRWRPAVLAGMMIAVITAAVSALNGPETLFEFGLAILNQEVVRQRTNLSPVLSLMSAMPESVARAVSALTALVGAGTAIWLIRRPIVALAIAELAMCGVVTNLYVTWLAVPVLLAIAALEGTPVSRLLDRALRPLNREEAAVSATSE
ncbi:MAG TPA: glycosyltransferase 87 family protein [Candidatus Limnocylindrales bacterium]|nr:glycosyltransferase 87 family protein [Candidatus Limnocylindrales bacterium]